MNFLTAVQCDVGIWSPLRFAIGKQGTSREVATASFFTEASQPRMTVEEQLIELYEQQRPLLLVYVCQLGLTRNEAEDIIHDAFLKAFDHLQAGGRSDNLRSWLYRVVHNLTMDVFRSRKHFTTSDDIPVDLLDTLLDSAENPEESVLRDEEIRRVQAVLGRLTSQQRAAVMLRADELRYREIAPILGVSIKRTSELIQRALARLAGDL